MPMNVKLTRLAENRLRASVTPDSYGHLQIHYLIWFQNNPWESQNTFGSILLIERGQGWLKVT